MEKAGERLRHDNTMEDQDLVKHHYNRRGLAGPQSMLFRKSHPMSWETGKRELPDLGVECSLHRAARCRIILC